MALLRGVDVSGYQGTISWEATSQAMGLRFVFTKVTEALWKSPDKTAQGNLAGARKAGLAAGGYVLPHLNLDVEAQARLHCFLASSVGAGAVGDLPLAVDLEEPAPKYWAGLGLKPEELRKRALAYLTAVEGTLGYPPLLYTYPDFWRQLTGASEPAFNRYPLWWAEYDQAGWPLPSQRPAFPHPWADFTFWQWSETGKLPSGAAVDLDVFWSESETDLQALLKKPSDPGLVADIKPLFVPPDPLEDDNS